MKTFNRILPGDVLLGVVFVKVMVEPFNPWSVAALGVSALIAYWNHELAASYRLEQRTESGEKAELELKAKHFAELEAQFHKFVVRFEELEAQVKDRSTASVFGGRR